MIENLTWSWLPPYRFQVCFFQLKKDVLFTTSFSEVSSLGWNSEKKERKLNAKKRNTPDIVPSVISLPIPCQQSQHTFFEKYFILKAGNSLE